MPRGVEPRAPKRAIRVKSSSVRVLVPPRRFIPFLRRSRPSCFPPVDYPGPTKREVLKENRLRAAEHCLALRRSVETRLGDFGGPPRWWNSILMGFSSRGMLHGDQERGSPSFMLHFTGERLKEVILRGIGAEKRAVCRLKRNYVDRSALTRVSLTSSSASGDTSRGRCEWPRLNSLLVFLLVLIALGNCLNCFAWMLL